MSAPVATVHERGRAAVLAGETTYDVPPSPSSPRWGVSVLLRPDEAAAERLSEATQVLAGLAGPHHWPTGGIGASHLTVCVLEPFREGVTAQDPAVRGYAEALARTAPGRPVARFRVAGLLLAPGGVLARAVPVDGPSGELRARTLAELGPAAAYEGDYRGDRWWTTLLHFAGPVADPPGLVDWVDARRELDLGPFTADRLELVRYAYDGARTVPVPLVTFPLGARGDCSRGS